MVTVPRKVLIIHIYEDKYDVHAVLLQLTSSYVDYRVHNSLFHPSIAMETMCFSSWQFLVEIIFCVAPNRHFIDVPNSDVQYICQSCDVV